MTYRHYTICATILLSLFFIKSGFCQNFDQVHIIGGLSNDEISHIQSNDDCELYIGGTFREVLTIANNNIEAIGKSDIFLAFMANDNAAWLEKMGSTEIDEIMGLISTGPDELIVYGSFVQSGSFLGTNLESSLSSKSSFILKIKDRSILWAKKLNGTSLEEIGEAVIDKNDNIYMSGYFSSDLFFEDLSVDTEADEGIFVLKIDENGNGIWMKSYGDKNLNRAKHLVYAPDSDQIIFSGEFNGEIQFGSTRLEATTVDFDVFIAAMNSDGEPLWITKAGGVLEDLNNDLIIDENQDLYLTGNFRGIINIKNQVEIRTTGMLDDNLYLIKLNIAGNPIWGRSIGSREGSETGFTLLEYDDQNIWMSAYANLGFEVDEFVFEAQADFFQHPFVASFSKEDGAFHWIKGFENGEGIVVPDVMHKTTCAEVLLGGAFNGAFTADNSLHTSQAYDGFLMRVVPPTPNSTSTFNSKSKISLYPNPSSGDVQFVSDQVGVLFIFDVNGKLISQKNIRKGKNGIGFDFSAGIYFWELKRDGISLEQGKVIRL